MQAFLFEAAAGLAAAGTAPLLQASLMSAEERRTVLQEFNSKDEPYDATALVHGSFAAWAKARGSRPCVVYRNCVWSYEEVGSVSYYDTVSA